VNYKVEGAIKKSKKDIILYIIIWIFIAIFFMMPFAYSILAAEKASLNVSGGNFLSNFISMLFISIQHPFYCIGQIIHADGGITTYIKSLMGFTFLYAIFVIISVVKSAPKNEYEDIEHGSSDWSQNGEQYQILSNKKGIILAEDNYLPVDKRGNVNVLVVGRIRFW